MNNDFYFSKRHLVDLTHNYSSKTIYWPTEEGFKLDKQFDGMTEKDIIILQKNFLHQNMVEHT